MKLSEAIARYDSINRRVDELSEQVDARTAFQNNTCGTEIDSLSDQLEDLAGQIALIEPQNLAEAAALSDFLLNRRIGYGEQRTDPEEDLSAHNNFQLSVALNAAIKRLAMAESRPLT